LSHSDFFVVSLFSFVQYLGISNPVTSPPK
jgi:hypothetical protein